MPSPVDARKVEHHIGAATFMSFLKLSGDRSRVGGALEASALAAAVWWP